MTISLTPTPPLAGSPAAGVDAIATPSQGGGVQGVASLRLILMAAASAGAIRSVSIEALDDADADVRVEQFAAAGCRLVREAVFEIIGRRRRYVTLTTDGGYWISVETDNTEHAVTETATRAA